jgi:hypothetical protein
MGRLLVKSGVEFGAELAPAGARILEVLKRLVPDYDFDITITSARDGTHSGPGDPHHKGEAFDLRVHNLTPVKFRGVLSDLKAYLYPALAGEPRRFYAALEGLGTPNAHIHIQRRKGTTYTVLDYLQD